MKNITTKQFSILSDHMAVYDFMVEIYQRDWRNGVAAPFWEYALCSNWMDKSYLHRCRMWRDGERLVGFCFHENPVSDVYFSLRPGYEALAPEMVAYAAEHMPVEGALRLVIFEGQRAIAEAAKAAGFTQCGGYDDRIYDYAKPLDYPLPDGFRFTEIGGVDVAKARECCWKGFDHEESEGPWNGEYEYAYAQVNAPHSHGCQYDIAVMNEAGDYVCYAGMWWVPENRLAYMEPLCTVPAYRHKGLAAAALSELYRRMKPLGANHMTGGGSPFYEKIGYGPGIPWTFWKR